MPADEGELDQLRRRVAVLEAAVRDVLAVEIEHECMHPELRAVLEEGLR